MIEPKELRIGNYVKNITSELPYSVIFGITEEYPYLKEITAFEMVYENLEGIPITEEWLFRFWFDNDDVNRFYKDGIYIVFYNEGCSILHNQLQVNIFYVHQLQNLYFALTGKELELKE